MLYGVGQRGGGVKAKKAWGDKAASGLAGLGNSVVAAVLGPLRRGDGQVLPVATGPSRRQR